MKTCPLCEREILYAETRIAELPAAQGTRAFTPIGVRYIHATAPRVCDRALTVLVPA